MNRIASIERNTKETNVSVSLDLDNPCQGNTSSGIAFFDHMLQALQSNAKFNFELKATGDITVDDHHVVEDCALVLGSAISQALDTRAGIARVASAYGILDDALILAAIDLSGRPFSDIQLDFKREVLGGLSTENISHFFQSLAARLGAAIHVRRVSGTNDHHQAEAAFKAVGCALGQAIKLTGGNAIPSTKGRLI